MSPFSRSWKAHLSSLFDITKGSNSSNLAANVFLPWCQYPLHLEHCDCKTREASEASFLHDAAHVLSNSRGKDPQNTGKRDRLWKSIDLGGLEDGAKLECKSVTGFSALFTLLSESEGLILLLWDLETQDVMRSCVGKNSFFVECNREEQLCPVLSGEHLLVANKNQSLQSRNWKHLFVCKY